MQKPLNLTIIGLLGLLLCLVSFEPWHTIGKSQFLCKTLKSNILNFFLFLCSNDRATGCFFVTLFGALKHNLLLFVLVWSQSREETKKRFSAQGISCNSSGGLHCCFVFLQLALDYPDLNNHKIKMKPNFLLKGPIIRC